MTNVELKVRCEDLPAVCRRALELGAADQGVLRQRDTYFRVPEGRLKLRQQDGRAEIIFYRRPDAPEARTCQYRVQRLGAEEGRELGCLLGEALGVLVEVRKARHLLLHGHTRIHLDEVEGLGRFVELETVVTDQSLEEAQAECSRVAHVLGLDALEPVPVSYADLALRLSPSG